MREVSADLLRGIVEVDETYIGGRIHGKDGSVVGTYHKISIKHLDAYLDELEHRYNNRKNQFLFRDTLMKLITAEKLPYQELVKAA
jgi:hypothetical protein